MISARFLACVGPFGRLVLLSSSVASIACTATGPTADYRAANAAPGTSEAMEARAFEAQLGQDERLACRISFEQSTAAAAAPPTIRDTGDSASLELAPEDVFMSGCLRLPRLVQKCRVFWYFAEHYRECADTRRAYRAQVQWEAERHTARRALPSPRHF